MKPNKFTSLEELTYQALALCSDERPAEEDHLLQ